MRLFLPALGAKYGQRLAGGGDHKREGFDIGRRAELAFIIHAHHGEIPRATKARHQLVFQLKHHRIRRLLGRHALGHAANNFVAGTAFHQIFPHARGGGGAGFAVTVKAGPDNRRITESAAFFHKQAAGGGGDAHGALFVEADNPDGVVAVVRA